jgi:hypothetical protein
VGEPLLQDRAQGGRFLRREVGQRIGEHLLAQDEDPARLTPPGRRHPERHRRAPAREHQPLLDERSTTRTATGATGNLGGELVRALAAAGEDVRGLTRDGRSAEVPAGAELVAGDLDRPESLAGALDGARAVFLPSATATWPAIRRRRAGRAEPHHVERVRRRDLQLLR